MGPFPRLTTPDPDTVVDSFEAGAQHSGAFGAGMVGMAMMMPDLGFQNGAPGVGSAGGGGLPTDAGIATLALSLALVPLALSAVAVFPPFATPRTVPAIAVIFSEGRDMTGTIRKRDVRRLYRMIKKRSPQYLDSEYGYENSLAELPSLSEIKYAVQNSPPKTVDFLTKAWNALGRF